MGRENLYWGAILAVIIFSLMPLTWDAGVSWADEDPEEVEIENYHRTQCQAPFTAKGRRCILRNDAIVAQTVEIQPDTDYDCRGYTLSAQVPGVVSLGQAPPNPPTPYQVSGPEVALYAPGSNHFRVQNCISEDFDFNVVIDGAKHDAANRAERRTVLKRNHFSGNTNSVLIIHSDNIVVKHNSHDAYGPFSLVLRSSNDIRLHHNDVRMKTAPFGVGFSPIFPRDGSAPTNIFIYPGSAARMGFGFPFPDLINIVINLGTAANPDKILSQHAFSAPPENYSVLHSRYEFIDGGRGFACFDSSDAVLGGKIKGNECLNTAPGFVNNGIFLGGSIGSATGPVTTPGQCCLDPNNAASCDAERLCAINSDCCIPGFDTDSVGDTSCDDSNDRVLGTCEFEVRTPNFVSRTQDFLVKDNRFAGPFQAGIALNETDNAQAIRNYVSGTTGAPVSSLFTGGISLRARAMESAVVAQNLVTGNQNALLLSRFGSPPVGFFGAKLQQNEFTENSARAIAASAGVWAFVSEVSFENKGNYWGRSCEEDAINSAGFLECLVAGPDIPNLLSTCGDPINADSPRIDIVDSHPYGESPVKLDRHGFVELAHPRPRPCMP